MEQYAIYLFYASIALFGVAALWWLIATFSEGVWWGLGNVLVVPGVVFFFKHFKKAVGPFVVLLLGGLSLAGAAAIGYYAQKIDLGPRERVVEGELHITLTDWDQNDYAVLADKKDTVVLQMANGDVTDETLQYLKGMDRLRELDLNDSQVTDEGLAVLAELPSLEVLWLRKTEVTDAGFREHLMGKESLKRVAYGDTGITRETMSEWRKAQKGRRAMQ